ncbi:MAG: SIMPL domain-containing protein [Candidatus Shapirobacteria bacterium]
MNNLNKIIIISVLIIVAIFVLPWKNVNWGKFNLNQTEQVMVTGQSKVKQKNQVASFSVGVNTIKSKKEDAVTETDKKINELIQSIKGFGIPTEDIKTQNVSVYQQEKTNLTSKQDWVANNTIEIVLREVDKANSLVNLLNSSGATNVSGPNFSLEDSAQTDNQKSLIDSAIADAREKADLIAKASGRKLGKVINVSENSGGNYPIMDSLSVSNAKADLEPGTSTVTKSLTVSFELK